MGKRGPQKQPTKLRILRGNPAKRSLPKGEPQPAELVDMEPPDELCDDGKRIWFAALPSLKLMGVATAADRDMFTNYCMAQAAAIDAARHLKAEGRVYWAETKNGSIQMKSAWVGIQNQALALAKQYAALFGFSPPARIDLALGADEKEDEFSKWKKGAKK